MGKISDLGVAKVIQADSKKTKTRVPRTVDFMPPRGLLKTSEYGPSLDIFCYGGVILNIKCVREDEEDERSRECKVSLCQHEPHNMAAGRADNQDVKGSHNN